MGRGSESPGQRSLRAFALEAKVYAPHVLGELLELLPSAGKKRFGSEGGEKYWTTGLFSQGPFKGLRRAALDFPMSTRLACHVVSSVLPGFPFTSVALLQQVRSAPHVDRNNLRGWPSLVFPLAPFKGGSIWVEGGSASSLRSVKGKPRLGEELEVSRGPVLLDGHKLHMTLPWTGIRRVAVAYCVKDPGSVEAPVLAQARRLGFTLPPKFPLRPPPGLGGKLVDFDATLGFPGEGPPPFLCIFLLRLLLTCESSPLEPRNPADAARAARRSPSGLPSGRVVLNRTGSYRDSLAVAFSQWLVEICGETLEAVLSAQPLDPERVAGLLIRYGQDLYGSGRPYWHFSETINMLSSRKPILRRQLQGAWDLAFAWQAEEPGTNHTALPPVVLVALLSAALVWGWTREAGCFALAFGGLMRIGEVVATTRRLLILPKDVGYTQQHILVKIEEPKTRFRGPRHQVAKVEAADLIQIAELAFSGLSQNDRLWAQSPQTLRKRLDSLLLRIGASPPPRGIRSIDLGSFRAGGATYMLQATEDSELIRRRGRWASSRVMEIYLQEITASTYLPALPAEQKQKILVIASGFSAVLKQALVWTKAGISSNIWYRLWPGDLSTHERK